MKRQGCRVVPCGSNAVWLGGVTASDFAALDELAVKLICLDSRFVAPLRQMGRTLGERIASEQGESPLAFEAALSSMISACGLGGVIESRFLHRSADGARLQITGCAEALGWQVPPVARTVCGFDAGLFEGFLSGVAGAAWRVEEVACLGLGHPSCEFVIYRGDTWEGVRHGRC